VNRDRGLYGQSNTEYGASMAIAALAKNLTTYLIVAHNDKVVRDAMNNQADSIPRIDPIGKTCSRSDGIMMSEMIFISEISLQATRERLL
jgi:hypothetical protein